MAKMTSHVAWSSVTNNLSPTEPFDVFRAILSPFHHISFSTSFVNLGYFLGEQLHFRIVKTQLCDLCFFRLDTTVGYLLSTLRFSSFFLFSHWLSLGQIFFSIRISEYSGLGQSRLLFTFACGSRSRTGARARKILWWGTFLWFFVVKKVPFLRSQGS